MRGEMITSYTGSFYKVKYGNLLCQLKKVSVLLFLAHH